MSKSKSYEIQGQNNCLYELGKKWQIGLKRQSQTKKGTKSSEHIYTG